MLSKRRCSDDQDFIINMNCSSESIGLPSCKRVCGERVEAVVGIDRLVTHVTKEVDGGQEVNQGEKRESVVEGRAVGEITKEATDHGVVGQLTGADVSARQEP